MKKLLAAALAVFLLAGCGDIKRQLEDHEERISRLEELCKEMNTNISALQTVVDAIQNYDYVTGVVPVKKGGEVTGYTITFTQSEPITIYHGQKGDPGAAGHSPKMGVRKAEDGIWYWTLDGEWLTDDNGRKVRAEGEQGLTPELKVEGGYWYVRYGTGEWTQLGKATGADGKDGDSFFRDVVVKGDQVTLVLASGEELVLPRKVQGGIALDPVIVTETTAHFTGKAIERTPDFQVGILYSKTSDVLVKTSELVLTPDFDPEGHFVLVLKNLLPDTRYYYRIYRFRNGVAEYGEVQHFTTQPMAAAGAIDLSAEGTANCYIVPKSGVYKFKTVKGNGNESVGEVASAEVLWESYGTDEPLRPGDILVPAIHVSEGWLQFMTSENYHEGDAVIAAKDAAGTILWSWHIWLTDQPVAQVYANEAGIMMDRNLGATNNDPGKRGSLGLLYQWGRKDPFLGMGAPRRHDIKYAAVSTGTWAEENALSDAEHGTIAYATAHPMQMITANNKNSDWLYTGDTGADHSRWAAVKTIYDPCPAGWRVPDGGEEGIWAKAGFNAVIEGIPPVRLDQVNEGKLFPAAMVGADVWYPAPGGVAPQVNSTPIFNYGMSGFYWSVTAAENRSYCLSLIQTDNSTDELLVAEIMPHFDALSVRCCKE